MADFGVESKIGSLRSMRGLDEGPSLGEVTFGALAVGANKDAFLTHLFDGLDDVFPQLSNESLADLESKLQGSTTADALKFVGEFGSLILPGLGAYSAGRAGVHALVKASTSGTLQASRKFLTQKAGTTAAANFAKTPLGLRAAEAVGGSVGFGLEGTARGLSAGEDFDEAALHGAQQFAVALAIEGGLVGLGRVPGVQRLLGERGASGSAKALVAREEKAEIERQLLQSAQSRLVRTAERIAAKDNQPVNFNPFLNSGPVVEAHRSLPKTFARVEKAKAESAKLRSEDVFGRQLSFYQKMREDLVTEANGLGIKVQGLVSERAANYYAHFQLGLGSQAAKDAYKVAGAKQGPKFAARAAENKQVQENLVNDPRILSLIERGVVRLEDGALVEGAVRGGGGSVALGGKGTTEILKQAKARLKIAEDKVAELKPKGRAVEAEKQQAFLWKEEIHGRTKLGKPFSTKGAAQRKLNDLKVGRERRTGQGPEIHSSGFTNLSLKKVPEGWVVTRKAGGFKPPGGTATQKAWERIVAQRKQYISDIRYASKHGVVKGPARVSRKFSKARKDVIRARKALKKSDARILKLDKKLAKEQQRLSKTQGNLNALVRGVPERGQPGLLEAFIFPERHAGFITRFMDTYKPPGVVARKGLRKFVDKQLGRVGMDLDEIGKVAGKIGITVGKSPETASRELGLSTAIAADMAKTGAIEARIIENNSRIKLVDQFEALRKAMGAPKEEFLGESFGAGLKALIRGRNGKFAIPVRDAWEAGGIKQVQAEFNVETAKAWSTIMNQFNETFQAVGKLGGLPEMSYRQLNKLGVAEYFPHATKQITPNMREKMVQRLSRTLRKKSPRLTQTGSEHQARQILSNMEKNQGNELRKLGNIDSNRLIPGTTRQKLVDLGEDFIDDDPFAVMDQLYAHMAHRFSFGRRFGVDGRIIDGIGEVAKKEGAPAARVDTLMQLFSGRSFGDQSQRKIARLMVNTQIISKLGLAQIPNLSQNINNVTVFGTKNFLQGIKDINTNSESRRLAYESLGLIDGAHKSMSRVILEELQTVEGMAASGPLDSVARAFMTANGFSLIEGMNRTISAATGIATFRDIATRHAQGRLVGRGAAIAREQFASLGLNLDEAVRAGFWRNNKTLQDEMIKQAGFNAARTTQFIQDFTRVPVYWRHPLGKVVFQFKTFAFNQGKFVRDNVFREASRGNMKPLATFMTLYPVAGELVNSALNNFRDNPKEYNGLERYVRDLAAVGGFGLMYSMVQSLSYRQIDEQLLGPTYGDASTLLEAIVSDKPMDLIRKEIEGQPSYRLGRAAGEIGIGLEEYIERGIESINPNNQEDNLRHRILEKR